MLNLIELWQNTITEQGALEVSTSSSSSSSSSSFGMPASPGYSNDTSPAAINFDRQTTQSSFAFKSSPHVIFVEDISTLKRVDFYDELPEILLTQEEENARLAVVSEQQARNPQFYDGNQMVITGVVYDEISNTIYMEAKKVPYSFIVTLSNKRFPEGSKLYELSLFKTGVLAPLITTDDVTILMQRKALGLYSVPSGFLEAHDDEKRLNFDDGRNLVTETATGEIREEIAGIKGGESLQFTYSEPQISSISFRKTATSPIRTVEFVALSYTNCHSSAVALAFLNKLAKDAHEHTDRYELVPLRSQDRDALLIKLLTMDIRLPGASLYLPAVVAMASLINSDAMIEHPRTIPGSSSKVWPIDMFVPRIGRPIALSSSLPSLFSYDSRAMGAISSVMSSAMPNSSSSSQIEELGDHHLTSDVDSDTYNKILGHI